MSAAARVDDDAPEHSGIRVAAHASTDTVKGLRQIVHESLPGQAADYRDMPLDDYRERVLQAQLRMCEGGYVRRIAAEILPQLSHYLDGDAFLVQTNLYLRAIRPFVPQHQEAINWHRETFYGADLAEAVNIWTPVSGVSPGNTLQYVAQSHRIADEDIVFEQTADATTPRFSSSHRIGFVYAPKQIVQGVDFARARPMVVPDFSSGIFPANLIHGAGVNPGDQIRVSVDFRIMPRNAWRRDRAKALHFASGKPYFEEF